MKRTGITTIAAVSLGSLMLLGSAASAFAADATPTPSPSKSAEAAPSAHPSPSASHAGKPDSAAHQALKAQREAINATARAAVEKARSDFNSVLAGNPTPEARAAAVAARKAAVESAKAARIAAMQALIPGWTPHSHEHSSAA